MANNYTQFSFEIHKLKKREVKWLEDLLRSDFEGTFEDDTLFSDREESVIKVSKALDFGRNCIDTKAPWPDFQWCLDLKQGGLWIYGEEWGNTFNVAMLVRAFLAKFRPKDVVCFSAAFTCSKPRLDEFGGESFVVTASGIYSDAGVVHMIEQAVKTGEQQKMGSGDIDIIVRPKKGKKCTS